jgi:hypothetical protein
VDLAIEKMDSQLKRWRLKIDQLAAKTQLVGGQAGFDTLMHIDELKALHAIAQSKIDEFRTRPTEERARLKSELKRACNDLDAAFMKPRR